jgi:hypothetical protein
MRDTLKNINKVDWIGDRDVYSAFGVEFTPSELRAIYSGAPSFFREQDHESYMSFKSLDSGTETI